MNFLSLDLEMNQPSGKIIQIGACVGNLLTGEVLGRYSALVAIDEPLTPFIEKLTGITEADLATRGMSLVEAYQGLIEFRAAFDDIQQCNPITWGGGDSLELKTQLQAAYDNVIVGKVFPWPFGRRWLDMKTLFQFRQIARGQKAQAGLAKALTKMGLKFQGQKHNALDDAVNTFLIACVLLKEFK